MNYQLMQTEQEREVSALRHSLAETQGTIDALQAALDNAAEDYRDMVSENRRLKVYVAELESIVEDSKALLERDLRLLDKQADEIDRLREMERGDKLLTGMVRAAGGNISWFQVARMLANCNREQRALLRRGKL